MEFGNNLSIIFSDFGAYLPQGETGDGLNVSQRCQFKVRISYPRDNYLASLRQVFTGGAIKSAWSQGQLNLTYHLMGGGKPLAMPVIWKLGEELTPESPDSYFTRSAEDTFPAPPNCKGEVKYQLKVDLTAKRPSTSEFLIGGLDSYEAELVQRLDLIPTFKVCTRRGR